MTGGLRGLLVLRYPYEYDILHFDLLAAPLFLMSVSVLAFGLRPVFWFWPAWLLLLAAYPASIEREGRRHQRPSPAPR
ncbi:hypothetical protein D7D52_19225 [Nocardia yunnanensis]|uniref:Uncharacterized protein n=1 Tax=Nocardia yunnanensis TaxID=2382165 RepID=A0A386ZDR7_9NOCA|nr:hypothetical protein [Nocardia yunnanensis]AYF75628.1 hypothetical protein D7D52_19225 [Nocardia yunnanensis]